MQPVFLGRQCVGGAVAERLFERGLCLPSGSNLTMEDLGRIIAVVRDVSHRARNGGKSMLEPAAASAALG